MAEPKQTVDQPEVSSQGKSSRFFYPTLNSLPEPITDLLENYSHVPRPEIIPHVLSVRNKAYQSHPYPCLGRFRFTCLDLSTYPAYKHAITALTRPHNDNKPDPIYLDVGCCLGQDIRKLIHDGAPSSHVYGADIISSFIDDGYELFHDEDRLPRSHFLVPGDVFALPGDENDALRVLDDKVDILHITAVFHLFDREAQKKIAHRCLRLMRKTSRDKVLILGGQVGNAIPQESARSNGSMMFRHNAQSWTDLWNEVIYDEEGPWKDVVKSVRVENQLEERDAAERRGDLEGAAGDPGAQERKTIGKPEDGYFWHVWEVWLEFN